MNDIEWKLGIVDSVSEGYISFVSNLSDLGDQVIDGKIFTVKGVNDFVYSKININAYLLMKILKVKNGTEDPIKQANSFISINKISFFVEPIGTLENGVFKSGTTQFPMVGSTIFGVNDKILSKFFSSIGDNLISIGTVNNYPNVSPDLNLRKLLTSHLAIVGNTGAGKSTTLRVLVDRINSVKDELSPLFKMFIFDVHGDYSELDFAKHINIKSMHLVLKNLSIEDWSSALLPSEKTQKPILRRAISIARISKSNKKYLYAMLTKLALENATRDGFFALKRIVTKWFKKACPNEVELLDNWKLNFGNETSEIKEVEEKIDELIDESPQKNINDLINKDCTEDFTLDELEEALDIVFGEEEVQGNKRSRNNSETMMARFRNLKNRYGGQDNILNSNNGEEITLRKNDNEWKENKIFIVDLTGLDDVALRLVSNYLVRSVFEFNLHFNRNNRKSMPFNYLYLDEAHRYVQNSQDDEKTIFDIVAREGRKFNVYLGIISQIPSDLSKTVMSQVGAYFIHRIQNSNDLDYIRRNVPSVSNSMVSRLPILPAGTCLLSGNAFDIPFELNINADNYGEASSSLSPLKDI